MTPSEIKRYLSERKTAPIEDIALHFDIDADAVRGMLHHWMRKGKVKRYESGGCGSDGCSGCGSHSSEIYEWVA